MIKKLFIGTGVVLVVLGVLIIIVVGPWPTYAASNVEETGYYQKALNAVDANLTQSTLGGVEQLRAGWASARLTPPVGTPLAGYGNRQGKPSTGIHDELYVKAVALSDGKDTVVLVGSDMLIVPNNIADLAREQVAATTGLTPNDILFNASHTHSGAGAWGPGAAAALFGGAYDENVMRQMAEAFGMAIIEAYGKLAPAEMACGDVEAPQYICNRAHDGPVDSELNYLVLKHRTGETCHVVSYSAHATVLTGNNMEFSGDYPGYLERAIETRTGGMAAFLAGALGSMGPKVAGPDGFTKAQTMGAALAGLVLDDAQDAAFTDHVEIASVGFAFQTPPLQFRLNRNWRLSPFALPMLGVDDVAWAAGVRLGDVFLYGTPCDMSGEISVELKEWAKDHGVDLWVLSFNGDYIGYVSPSKYYSLPRDQTDSYEMYTMSWIGPNQEAFFTGLLRHMVSALMPPPPVASSL